MKEMVRDDAKLDVLKIITVELFYVWELFVGAANVAHTIWEIEVSFYSKYFITTNKGTTMIISTAS